VNKAHHRPVKKQQILVTVADMTGLTNNVQQWDLFAMHVANVTTTPKYVDRSPQKDFQMADDNDNSKAKTQETHNNQQSTINIGRKKSERQENVRN
jgi:hypothetical protein